MDLQEREPGTGLDGYGQAVVAVAIAVAVLLPVRGHFGVIDVLLLFVVPCLATALLAGVGPAVFAAFLGFLAANLFFVPPYLTLTVAAPQHWTALLVYLAVASLVGVLTARVRERTAQAEAERGRAAALNTLNSALIGGATREDVLAAIISRTTGVFRAESARILLTDGNGRDLETVAAAPAEWRSLEDDEIAAAWRAIAERAPISEPSFHEEPHRIFLPIATASKRFGVIEVERRPRHRIRAFSAEEQALLGAFATQAAIAVDRANLAAEAGLVAGLEAAGDLKTALLAAVSHDLKTPLVAIKTAATSLLDPGVQWDEASRRDFLEAIDEEADRLTRMVDNLLDLSRIEGGVLRPRREWYDAAELVADVVGRFSPRMTDRAVAVHVDPALPLLYLDYVKIGQVLANLLENVLRHTPGGSPVRIEAVRNGNAAVFSVSDEGPGLPLALRSRLFDIFYQAGDDRAAGHGIGLAICKGLVEAHGGRIWATSHPGGGTTFAFSLPLAPGPNGGVAEEPTIDGSRP
jgi:two-component system sensor histidine kinase KdpD